MMKLSYDNKYDYVPNVRREGYSCKLWCGKTVTRNRIHSFCEETESSEACRLG